MQAIEEVQRDSDEWNRMWAELASKNINSGDADCVHPETLESWQYMGTKNGVHSFRHRHHPATGKREYLEIVMRCMRWQGDNAVDVANLLPDHNFHHKDGVLTIHQNGDDVRIQKGEWFTVDDAGHAHKEQTL